MACGGFGGTPKVPVQGTVKVALVDVFSGPAGAAGRASRNGLQVAVDAVNAQGGLLGQRLEVAPADGERSPNKSTELVRQQLADDSVKFLVGPSSTASFQAAKAGISQAVMPNCVTGVSDDALAGAATSFRSGAADRTLVQVLLAAVHRARPEIKKLAAVDEGDDAGAAMDRLLADQAPGQGLTYAGRTVVADGDHRNAVQQLLNQGVQGIVVSDQPAVAARTAQAVSLLAAGARVALLGLTGPASYDFTNLAGDAAVGVTVAATNRSYLTGAAPGSWPVGYRAFVETVARQYGLASDGIQIQGAPEASDCLLLWTRAVARAGTFRGRDVASALQSLELPADETALGVPERLSPADRSTVGTGGVLVYTWVKDGGRYRLKQV
jgi:branched-chain amino acid transport system substrate-binding protein